MSPWPHAPGSGSRLTKKRPFFPTGVGQKSSAGEFTGSPRFCGAPQGAVELAREAIQMSSPPLPPGRLEATYRLKPSGDWIGHPSRDGVLSSELLALIVSIFCAAAHADANPASTSPASTTASTVAPRAKRVIRALLSADGRLAAGSRVGGVDPEPRGQWLAGHEV